MTGFRHAGHLHAYSGGTVREFHTIPYSPSGFLMSRWALKRYSLSVSKIALKTVFVNRILKKGLRRKEKCATMNTTAVACILYIRITVELEWENPNGTKPP